MAQSHTWEGLWASKGWRRVWRLWGRAPGTCGWYPKHLANGTQRMGQGVQLILDPLQGSADGVRTVQYINGQCVWVKLHREWALDTRGIVPEEKNQYESFNHRRLDVGDEKAGLSQLARDRIHNIQEHEKMAFLSF